MCIIEKAPPSLEFVTTPLLEADSPVLVSSSPSESLDSFMEACMFTSLEDILTLCMIFTQSLTLGSFEPVDEDVVATSSLALGASEVLGVTLAIVPLQARPASPYDLD